MKNSFLIRIFAIISFSFLAAGGANAADQKQKHKVEMVEKVTPNPDFHKQKINYLEKLVDKFFTISDDEKKITSEKITLLKNAFLDEIDFKWNARRAIRSYWKQFNAEQKKEFVELYIAMLTHTWESKAEIILNVPRYAVKVDPKLRAINSKDDDVDLVISSQGNRKIIITMRVRGGEPYAENEFKIVNLTIEGIDMAESYNSQFKSFIEKNSIEKLFDELRKYKNAKAPKGIDKFSAGVLNGSECKNSSTSK